MRLDDHTRAAEEFGPRGLRDHAVELVELLLHALHPEDFDEEWVELLLREQAPGRREGRTQHLVALYDLSQRAREYVLVERACEAERRRRMERPACDRVNLLPPLAEEPALLYQRDGGLHAARDGLDRLGPQPAALAQRQLDGSRELCERRRFEQKAERQLGLQLLAHPQQYPHRQKRVAAQLEKVVVEADAFYAQQLTPDSRERLFDGGTRGRELAAVRMRFVRGRQRPAVDFPAGRQRQPLHEDEGGRDHVVRQLALEPSAQLRGVGHRPGLQAHVANQRPVLPPVRALEHDALAHAGQTLEGRFDFTRLDAEPTNL